MLQSFEKGSSTSKSIKSTNYISLKSKRFKRALTLIGNFEVKNETLKLQSGIS